VDGAYCVENRIVISKSIGVLGRVMSNQMCMLDARITCAFDPSSPSPACVRFYHMVLKGDNFREGRKSSIVVREARANPATYSLFNALPNWIVRSGGCVRKRGHLSFCGVAFVRGFEVHLATDAVDVSVINSCFGSGAKLRLFDVASWYCPHISPFVSIKTQFEHFDEFLFRLVNDECATILANGMRDPSTLIVVDASGKKKYKGPVLRLVRLLNILGILQGLCIVYCIYIFIYIYIYFSCALRLFSASIVQLCLFLADAILSENFADKMGDYDFPAIVALALRIMKIYPPSNPIENESNNAIPNNARSSVSVAEKANVEFGDGEIVIPLIATLCRLLHSARQSNKVRTEGKSNDFVNQLKRTELFSMAIYLMKSRSAQTVHWSLGLLCAYFDATESLPILNCEEMVSVFEAISFMLETVKRDDVKFLGTIPRIVYQAATYDVVKSALLKVDWNLAWIFLLKTDGNRSFPLGFLIVVEGFLRECPREVAEIFFEQGVQQN
jgi:hypothetical protein